jgi:hypothetical protein
MKISSAEQEAIRDVLDYGEEWGYGNLIAHLQTAWAKMLMARYRMNEKAARAATASDGRAYPFALQNDLIQRGEWDETWKRYAKKPKPKKRR